MHAHATAAPCDGNDVNWEGGFISGVKVQCMRDVWDRINTKKNHRHTNWHVAHEVREWDGSKTDNLYVQVGNYRVAYVYGASAKCDEHVKAGVRDVRYLDIHDVYQQDNSFLIPSVVFASP